MDAAKRKPDKIELRLIGALYMAALRGRAMSGADFINERIMPAWLSGPMYNVLLGLEEQGIIVGRWLEESYPRRRVYELKRPPEIGI